MADATRRAGLLKSAMRVGGKTLDSRSIAALRQGRERQ
jgi:hypothetical protein